MPSDSAFINFTFAHALVQELWRNGLLNDPSDKQAERAVKIIVDALATAPTSPSIEAPPTRVTGFLTSCSNVVHEKCRIKGCQCDCHLS